MCCGGRETRQAGIMNQFKSPENVATTARGTYVEKKGYANIDIRNVIV